MYVIMGGRIMVFVLVDGLLQPQLHPENAAFSALRAGAFA
jgi:hypothetical protein